MVYIPAASAQHRQQQQQSRMVCIGRQKAGAVAPPFQPTCVMRAHHLHHTAAAPVRPPSLLLMKKSPAGSQRHVFPVQANTIVT
jgi:hypothetical protein